MESYAVIDLETTGHDVDAGDSIIDIGIVVIENDEITSTYATLLKPSVHIPPFVEQLTGIYNKDVQHAPTFQEKMDEILSMLRGHTIIAHNVPFDVGFLNDVLLLENKSPLANHVIDTVEVSRFLYPKAPGYKLNELAQFFNLNHEDPHRALSDAYVTAQLFLICKDKLSALPYETLRHLIHLEKQLESDLYEILFSSLKINQFSIQNLDAYVSHRGMSYKPIHINKKKHQKLPRAYGEIIDEIFSTNGTLSNYMVDYKERTGQQEIANTVFQSFEEESHAFIEAGTGIGKTIAYLIPALYKAVSTSNPIVISTYTTQLQTQLLEEHIPLLKKVFPAPFQATVMKGKQHYLSIERFAQELEYMIHDNYDITLTKAILLIWITETDTGDIDEIQLPTSGYTYFKKISAQSEKYGNDAWSYMSYYKKAMEQAKQSDLIVTNHALLSTHMKNDYVLPYFDHLIIDEAHHFDRVIAKQFGTVLNYVSVQHILTQLEFMNKTTWTFRLFNHKDAHALPLKKQTWSTIVEDAQYEVDMLFRSLFSFVKHQKKNKRLSDTGRLEYVLDPARELTHSEKKMQEMALHVSGIFSNVLRQIKEIIEIIRKNEDDNEELLNDMRQSMIELKQVRDDLRFFFTLQKGNSHIKWIEIEVHGAKNAVHLYCEKVQIADDLQKGFFNLKKSIVFTSATLSMKNSFDYILQTYGLLKSDVHTISVPSPFNYQEQVQVYVPKDFPSVQNERDKGAFVEATVEAILSLATVTNGRMLVLFTSYEMLRSAYHLLKEFSDLYGYTIIAQGVSSGSRTRLMKNFQSIEKSILLGTSSFWEGIDIPGDSLSCIVIARLPFQSPQTPEYKAIENECVRTGENPFYDYALPHAVLRFKQGFGRLVRKESDRGIIFICDERIMTASYRSYFIDSIPKIPLVHDSMTHIIKHAEKWF